MIVARVVRRIRHASTRGLGGDSSRFPPSHKRSFVRHPRVLTHTQTAVPALRSRRRRPDAAASAMRALPRVPRLRLFSYHRAPNAPLRPRSAVLAGCPGRRSATPSVMPRAAVFVSSAMGTLLRRGEALRDLVKFIAHIERDHFNVGRDVVCRGNGGESVELPRDHTRRSRTRHWPSRPRARRPRPSRRDEFSATCVAKEPKRRRSVRHPDTSQSVQAQITRRKCQV